MPFPLGEYIDRHAGVRHHLAQSGLRGTLPELAATLRNPRDPDPERLRGELARVVGVAPSRLFLTHGASEGNALVLTFLARSAPRHPGPTFVAPVPEYPPLVAAAGWAGFHRARASRAAVAISSRPHNPTGERDPPDPDFTHAESLAASVLIDETFREFTLAPSRAGSRDERVWTTGTFTKVYGADDIRVGFVVAPAARCGEFGEFHGVMTDEIPPASVGAARAILRDRRRLLGAARARFQRNLSTLREELPGVRALAAPVYFDRPRPGLDGDALARAALRADVLVCPGSFFGDRQGVRLTLTRPTFAVDLAAYRKVRDRYLDLPTIGSRRRA